MDVTNTFSRPANDLIQIMRWLQGESFARTLILRCYRVSNSEKVNIATVERVLGEMTREYDAKDRA